MSAHSPIRRPLKSRQHRWAAALARRLTAAGATPNAISLLSILMAGGAGLCFWHGWYAPAAAFIQLRLLCNLLDGMVAVEGGKQTASGEIFNDFPDRLSDAFVLAGAGYSPAGSVALSWIAAYLAALTAYARVLGGAAGLPQDFRGPMAKPQRMAVMTAACIAALIDPRAIAVGLGVVAVGSLVTVIMRLRRIVLQLESR